MKPLYVRALTFVSCTNHSNMILSSHDYAHGDWLLLNVNHAEHIVRVIDDEKVLQDNRGGIRVAPQGECGIHMRWFLFVV